MNYRFANGVTWNWTDTDAWEPQPNWNDPVRHRMGVRLEGTEGWVFICAAWCRRRPRRC